MISLIKEQTVNLLFDYKLFPDERMSTVKIQTE